MNDTVFSSSAGMAYRKRVFFHNNQEAQNKRASRHSSTSFNWYNSSSKILHRDSTISSDNNKINNTIGPVSSQNSSSFLLIEPSNTVMFVDFTPGVTLINKFSIKNQSNYQLSLVIIGPKLTSPFKIRVQKNLDRQTASHDRLPLSRVSDTNRRLTIAPGVRIEVFATFCSQNNNQIHKDLLIIKDNQGSLENIELIAYPKKNRNSSFENLSSQRNSSVTSNQPLQSVITEEESKKESRHTESNRESSYSSSNSDNSSGTSKSETSSQRERNKEISYHLLGERMVEFKRMFDELKSEPWDRKMKNQSFIGNSELTSEDKQRIEDSRRETETRLKIEELQKIKNRFKIETPANQCPIVNKPQNKIVKWDESKNNSYLFAEKGLDKFHDCIRTQIVGLRYRKGCSIWGKYLDMSQEGVLSNKEILQRLKSDLEYKKRHSKNEELLPKSTAPTILFSKNKIQAEYMPLNEADGLSYYNFEVNPRAGFDDWIPIEELTENLQEVMEYESVPHPVVSEYFPVIANNNRQGAIQECILQKRSGVDLVKKQLQFKITYFQCKLKPLPSHLNQMVYKQQSDDVHREWMYFQDKLNYADEEEEQKLNPVFQYCLDSIMEKSVSGCSDRRIRQNAFSCKIPDLPSNYQLASLSPLNFEICHYSREYEKDNSNDIYDCGFYSDIESHVNKMIGDVCLEDNHLQFDDEEEEYFTEDSYDEQSFLVEQQPQERAQMTQEKDQQEKPISYYRRLKDAFGRQRLYWENWEDLVLTDVEAKGAEQRIQSTMEEGLHEFKKEKLCHVGSTMKDVNEYAKNRENRFQL